jgi:HlyD family secretion protein
MRRLEAAMATLDRSVLEARLGDYDWQEKEHREQIAAVRALLAATRADLRRTRITAPATGVVLRIVRESEQVVAAGTPILELGDLGDLEVEAEFLSEDAARMRVGMAAEIFGGALGERTLSARVVRIHPSAFTKVSSLGVEQQRVTVVLEFAEAPSGLGDAFRVHARVVLEARPDAVRVAEGALFRGEEGWAAFRLEDDRARVVRVETGIRDGRVREVLAGLAPGERVVLHPPDDLADGARVAPIGE